IRLVLRRSPQAMIYGPLESRKIIRKASWGASVCIEAPHTRWFNVASGVKARSVPAAHVFYEVDTDRRPRYVGYCLKAEDKLIYHAGDTVLHPKLLHCLKAIGRPDVAFIPMNERNYYRERRGIVGNLTVREALGFAREIGAKTLIPIHWDMFTPNGA